MFSVIVWCNMTCRWPSNCKKRRIRKLVLKSRNTKKTCEFVLGILEWEVLFGQSTNSSCFELTVCGVHQPFAFVSFSPWLSIAVKVLIPGSGTEEWEQGGSRCSWSPSCLPYCCLMIRRSLPLYCLLSKWGNLATCVDLIPGWSLRVKEPCHRNIPSATGESPLCGNCRYWCVCPVLVECFWGAGCDAFWCPAALTVESPCLCLHLFSVKWPGKGNCCSRVARWG